MNSEKSNHLKPYEITYIIIGSTVGLGILRLPNDLVKNAYEDAWIIAVISAIYPMYMALMGIYFCRIHPNENILVLSKKYMGNVIGTAANLLFLFHFIIVTAFIVSGFSNLYRVYAVEFLKPFAVVSLELFTAGLLVYMGLKTIARVNTLAFFVLLLTLLGGLAALRKGSYLNLLPLFRSSAADIAKGMKDAVFSYLGVETLFLIYPAAEKGRKIKKSVFVAVCIIMVIYTMVIELTIYYEGTDILLKSFWSFITVSESLNIPIINNFRFIFASLWMFIAIKGTANYFYACEFIVRDFFKGVKRENIICGVYIVLVCITMNMAEETVRSKYMNLLLPIIVIFNVIYVSVIAVIMTLKRKKVNEK